MNPNQYIATLDTRLIRNHYVFFNVKQSTELSECVRMSFLFPESFRTLLQTCKMKYNKDMTYIIMEAVNEYVLRKESIHVDEQSEV